MIVSMFQALCQMLGIQPNPLDLGMVHCTVSCYIRCHIIHLVQYLLLGKLCQKIFVYLYLQEL